MTDVTAPLAPPPTAVRWARWAFPVLAALLSACGGDRIPLSSMAPPLIRVLLGAPREAATIGVADAWEVVSVEGGSYANRGTLSDHVRSAGILVALPGNSMEQEQRLAARQKSE